MIFSEATLLIVLLRDSPITFTYNADGIRTSKTVYDVEHKYILNGTQIIGETWLDGEVEYLILYLYDENGTPIGMQFRTNEYDPDEYATYYFDKNLQGDIVAIYNRYGTKIGTYTYDACLYSSM